MEASFDALLGIFTPGMKELELNAKENPDKLAKFSFRLHHTHTGVSPGPNRGLEEGEGCNNKLYDDKVTVAQSKKRKRRRMKALFLMGNKVVVTVHWARRDETSGRDTIGNIQCTSSSTKPSTRDPIL